MITSNTCAPPLPAAPFTFSILLDSPMRRNLRFCPVSALIFPLASLDIHYAAMIVAGLDILMTFLFKRSLAHPPSLSRIPPDVYPMTLTLSQLTQLMRDAINGQLPAASISQSVPGQGLGPVGPDEPLFPDNLSVSLSVAAPFAPFDGSPDTSFNVPLFEIPGAPGNLIIAAGLIMAQFFIERAGAGTPNGNGNDGNDNGNGTYIGTGNGNSSGSGNLSINQTTGKDRAGNGGFTYAHAHWPQ